MYRSLLLLAKYLRMNQLGKRNGDQAEMILVMGMEWMERKPPPVSIEDRTFVGSVDRV